MVLWDSDGLFTMLDHHDHHWLELLVKRPVKSSHRVDSPVNRNRVTLQTDGQVRTGRDVVIAAMLGAEEGRSGRSGAVDAEHRSGRSGRNLSSKPVGSGVPCGFEVQGEDIKLSLGVFLFFFSALQIFQSGVFRSSHVYRLIKPNGPCEEVLQSMGRCVFC